MFFSLTVSNLHNGIRLVDSEALNCITSFCFPSAAASVQCLAWVPSAPGMFITGGKGAKCLCGICVWSHFPSASMCLSPDDTTHLIPAIFVCQTLRLEYWGCGMCLAPLLWTALNWKRLGFMLCMSSTPLSPRKVIFRVKLVWYAVRLLFRNEKCYNLFEFLFVCVNTLVQSKCVFQCFVKTAVYEHHSLFIICAHSGFMYLIQQPSVCYIRMRVNFKKYEDYVIF